MKTLSILFIALLLSCGGGLQTHEAPHGSMTGMGPRGAAKKVEYMLDRTVQIRASQCKDGGRDHSGSGVIMYSNGRFGRVATAKHVVDRDCTYTITDNNGINTYGIMFRHHKSLDVSTLGSLGLKAVSNTPVGDTYLGEPIFALGYPMDLLQGRTWLTVTRGVAAADYEGEFRFTAPIYPGNSGGPVFDRQGNLVGIISAAMFRFGSPMDGMYYAVKASEIAEAMP